MHDLLGTAIVSRGSRNRPTQPRGRRHPCGMILMPTRTSHAEGGGRMPVARIVPPHAVDRPELLARLDVGMDAPLTLVVAPAGSGKSVLLTQWAATLGDARVAWLDVSAPDSDAVHFARRLLAELGVARPDPGRPGRPARDRRRRTRRRPHRSSRRGVRRGAGEGRRHPRRPASTVEHRSRDRPVAAGGPAAVERAFRLLVAGRPQARLEPAPAAARARRAAAGPARVRRRERGPGARADPAPAGRPRRWPRRSWSGPRGGPPASS